jgi:predicted glutamine amidotransferase
MCLLITQTKTSPILSDEWLKDFFSYNSDGVGVMRSENNELIVEKILPKSAAEFISFYQAHIAGNDCAFHLRMKTHGHIDLSNCHPYMVLNQAEHGRDLWLMHNGILHTGNSADISMSDTFHYINDYLKPMIAKNPDFVFTTQFAELIGDHIGASNKFVLMDNLGNQQIVNQSEGYYWAGLWLSNTYAWTASDNASKTVEIDPELIYTQSLEKPTSKKSWQYNSYSYGYDYSSNAYSSYDRTNYSDPVGSAKSVNADTSMLDDIEMILDDLGASAYHDAGSMPLADAIEFCTYYNVESFYDLAMMVTDGRMSEDFFLDCLYDYDLAENSFLWLKTERNEIQYAD